MLDQVGHQVKSQVPSWHAHWHFVPAFYLQLLSGRLVNRICVCSAIFLEQLCDFAVAKMDSPLQWHPISFSLGIDIGATLHEPLHGVCVCPNMEVQCKGVCWPSDSLFVLLTSAPLHSSSSTMAVCPQAQCRGIQPGSLVLMLTSVPQRSSSSMTAVWPR